MRWLVMAAVGLCASISTAWAQDYQEGSYDGRSIPGWVYRADVSQQANGLIWVPTEGAGVSDGTNCNVRVAMAGGPRAMWEAQFVALNSETMAAMLEARGTRVHPGNRAEPFTHFDRPALRHVMTGTVDGEDFDFLTVVIGGADRMITLTCTVRAGGYAEREAAFNAFVSGLVILGQPPA